MVVLVGILVPLTVTGTWALRTVTNTDHYVSTLAPLIDEPVVQQEIATLVVDQLFTAVHVQAKLTEKLPAPTKFLAAPLTTALRREANKAALSVVASPQFAKFWNASNRLTHHAAVSVLSGDTQSGKATKISVELNKVLINSIKTLNAKGITLFNPILATIQHAQSKGFVVVTAHQLHTVQTAFHLGIKLRVVLPIVLALFIVGALLLTVDRRKTVLRLAAAGVIGLVVLEAILVFARKTFINAVPNSDVAAAVWKILLRGLVNEIRWVALLGLVIVLVAWIRGPSSKAARSRLALSNSWAWLQNKQKSHELGTKTAELQHRAQEMRGLLSAIACGLCFFIVLIASSTTVILWSFVILGVVLLALNASSLKRRSA